MRREAGLLWSRRGIVLAAAALGTLLAVSHPASLPAQQGSVLRLRPPAPNCPVCDLWLRYEDVVLQAQQEVGSIHGGVFYFYHAADPSVIEPLIRFAHERSELGDRLREDAQLRKSLGEICGHRAQEELGIELELSTSARGILALLTARDPAAIEELRTRAGQAVRGKIPVWF